MHFCVKRQIVVTTLLIGLIAACSSVEPEAVPTDEQLESVVRRIDTPRAQDTLRLSSPFRLKAAVDCHNPIIKLRVEITDRSEAAGDGNVLAAIELPTSGTTEVRVDTLLAFHQLSRMTSDNRYGFVLVEVYEGLRTL